MLGSGAPVLAAWLVAAARTSWGAWCRRGWLFSHHPFSTHCPWHAKLSHRLSLGCFDILAKNVAAPCRSEFVGKGVSFHMQCLVWMLNPAGHLFSSPTSQCFSSSVQLRSCSPAPSSSCLWVPTLWMLRSALGLQCHVLGALTLNCFSWCKQAVPPQASGPRTLLFACVGIAGRCLALASPPSTRCCAQECCYDLLNGISALWQPGPVPLGVTRK